VEGGLQALPGGGAGTPARPHPGAALQVLHLRAPPGLRAPTNCQVSRKFYASKHLVQIILFVVCYKTYLYNLT
jgi:hypothetical protein